MSSLKGEDERADARPGRLVIVCGLPGSGKTTRALNLAAQYQGVRRCASSGTQILVDTRRPDENLTEDDLP